MAITFDASSDGTVISTSTPSWSHTIAGNLLVVEAIFQTGAVITGATYNSVANDGELHTSANGWENYLLWWFSPAAGTHTVALTFSGSATGAGRSTSYAGVDTAVTVVTNTGSTASNANAPTVSVTTTVANSWLVGIYENHTRQEFAGTDTVMRTDNSQGDGIFDDNGSGGATGNYHLNVNTGATASPWSVTVAAFAPTGGGGGGGGGGTTFVQLERGIRGLNRGLAR